jgi:hypothetical protein
MLSELMLQPSLPSGCGPSPDSVSTLHIHTLLGAISGPASCMTPLTVSLSAVSGRQLQPEGPDAETEENHSVSETQGGSLSSSGPAPILSWA